MKFNILIFLAGWSFLLIFPGCGTETGKDPVRIALSKGSPDSSYANYYHWIHTLDSTVVCTDMYDMPIDSAIKLFGECSGLILTGGTDIHPGFYDKAHDTARCMRIDGHRDLLEMTLIDSALAWGMPILGICRGHQVLNVALGGSLIVDIPSDFGTTVRHQCEDYLGCFHSVTVDAASLLYEISKSASGEVNTNHHQSIDRVAPPLKATAFADDGLIEAAEWNDPINKAFLLGVQWHPERLRLDNPLSGKVGFKFLSECRNYNRQPGAGNRSR